MKEDKAILPRKDRLSRNSQDSQRKKSPARSPSVAILKKNFEETRQHEEEDSKKKETASAIDTSKLLLLKVR